jgi:hypothetical protein
MMFRTRFLLRHDDSAAGAAAVGVLNYSRRPLVISPIRCNAVNGHVLLKTGAAMLIAARRVLVPLVTAFAGYHCYDGWLRFGILQAVSRWRCDAVLGIRGEWSRQSSVDHNCSEDGAPWILHYLTCRIRTIGAGNLVLLNFEWSCSNFEDSGPTSRPSLEDLLHCTEDGFNLSCALRAKP